MQIVRKRRSICLMALGLAVVSSAVWFAWPRDPSLLARSKVVASTADWLLERAGYDWLSDSEILFFRNAGKHIAPGAWIKDAASGRERRAENMNTAFREKVPPGKWGW